MSILIKGAKMPKYCIACPCLDKDLQICEVLKRDMDIFKDKLPDCPLVEIPSANVVEASKILQVADEQEKQGFIQTAKVLRELVK